MRELRSQTILISLGCIIVVELQDCCNYGDCEHDSGWLTFELAERLSLVPREPLLEVRDIGCGGVWN